MWAGRVNGEVGISVSENVSFVFLYVFSLLTASTQREELRADDSTREK